MLYRTLSEAQAKGSYVSWIETVILRVKVAGREFFRTYDFDSTRHKCKRCRKARQRGRLVTNGHVCPTCGNPYAGFIRQGRTKQGGKWISTQGHVGNGRLH
jgi:hypothetical protein